MPREGLAEDMAYVRTLAEEGRDAPLLGGRFLVFWGALNSLVYLLHWALISGRLPGAESGIGFAALWISYGLIAAIGSRAMGAGLRDKPGKSSISVRAERAAWRGVGYAAAFIAFGCLARMALFDDSQAPNAIMGPVFACFGVAMLTTAMLSAQTWLYTFVGLAFAAALALCVLANQDWAYLIAALASAIVLLVPGVTLMRREPAAMA